mmetsp:Transcript_10729/g.35604  ORF Transcript_10729/g.35604 Transcript_10729/m.35604 type:complete len:88 (+) Transcript_10729:1671-1934(+)
MSSCGGAAPLVARSYASLKSLGGQITLLLLVATCRGTLATHLFNSRLRKFTFGSLQLASSSTLCVAIATLQQFVLRMDLCGVNPAAC